MKVIKILDCDMFSGDYHARALCLTDKGQIVYTTYPDYKYTHQIDIVHVCWATSGFKSEQDYDDVFSFWENYKKENDL